MRFNSLSYIVHGAEQVKKMDEAEAKKRKAAAAADDDDARTGINHY